jgi:hypothetical protein
MSFESSETTDRRSEPHAAREKAMWKSFGQACLSGRFVCVRRASEKPAGTSHANFAYDYITKEKAGHNSAMFPNE